MITDTLRYEADGLSMESQLFIEDRDMGPRPGILVFPEAYGINEHAKHIAEELAKLGYVALACDIYGDGALQTDPDVAKAGVLALYEQPLRIRSRARGALDAVAKLKQVDPTRIAAIGYCFGGTMSLELARSGAPILGVVGFHCGLSTKRPEDASNIRARILIQIGADDPAVPAEQRAAFEKEMREGGVHWQLKLYGGVVHSFTRPDADTMNRPEVARYDEVADRNSWREMQAFLEDIF